MAAKHLIVILTLKIAYFYLTFMTDVGICSSFKRNRSIFNIWLSLLFWLKFLTSNLFFVGKNHKWPNSLILLSNFSSFLSVLDTTRVCIFLDDTGWIWLAENFFQVELFSVFKQDIIDSRVTIHCAISCWCQEVGFKSRRLVNYL